MFYKLLFNQNGRLFDPQENGKIICKEIKRQAPIYEVKYEDFEGANGSREVNASFRPFELVLTFDIFYKNEYDKELIITELHQIVFPGFQFYVTHELSPGKRFKVNPSNFELAEEENDYSTIEVTFDVPSGCSESLSTTLSEFSLDDEWQFSQNLEAADYKYSFDVSRFQVFNAGDFAIDPREHALKITLQGESLGNARIFNRTTDESFIYYPEFSTYLGQTVTIDRVYPKSNGVHCGINTNLELITLAPGINEIEIQNVANVKSSWDFRFLYK
ncbi:phage tail family protein [Enterococcus raffinosus]|nr:phage tail family protein [Enterococcus raffinosus]MDK7992682.1 phage tail family protein [Enterococcus raffinosus]UXC24402.1 phage tail family protein [Enterococcus raffinosus]DAI91468.1 MAG TPA: distal tail protein [Caudoviricetes sp.]